MRLGPGEERRAFVDLIERVRADHQRVFATVDHGLGEREQRFAGAIDRQHVVRRVEPAVGNAEAAFAPMSNRFAQSRDAQSGRVNRHLIQVAGQGLRHKVWRAVFRFADGQGDRALVGVRLDAAKQGAEFLERVGLQLVKSVVHCWRISVCSWRAARYSGASVR